MRLSIVLSSFTLGAAMLFSPALARAQHGHGHHGGEEESDYPLSYVERPLTLPRLALAPELEFELGRAEGATATTSTGRETLVGINIGAAFGITKDLEVGAFILPLRFAPKVTYGSAPDDAAANLQFFGTFRFFNNHFVEIGARLRLYAITQDFKGAQITPSVPFRFHLHKRVSLDAEVAIPITAAGDGYGAHVGLNVPLALAVDIIEPLHVGVRTGLQVFDFNPNGGSVGNYVYIPLGFFAGFAIGGKRPIVDIDAFFQWDRFATPGGSLGGDKIVAGDFQTGLAVRGYFYFGG